MQICHISITDLKIPPSSVWVIRKSKVIRKTVTLMLVVILSLVTWFPHMLVYFLKTFCRDRILLSDGQLMNLRVIVWYFCYLSAALNPFVYAFRWAYLLESGI